MATRQTLKVSKNIEAAVIANVAPFRFPKRADFHFDFPKRENFGLPALVPGKAGNSAGVAASWSNESVKAARLTKNGVRVTFDGQTAEYRSVAEAFRTLRLPMQRHIKFRLGLKASGSESFVHSDKMYLFALV